MEMKEYFNFGPLVRYFFRKRDKGVKESMTIKAMHIVNKISISIFLICLIVILYRLIFRG